VECFLSFHPSIYLYIPSLRLTLVAFPSVVAGRRYFVGRVIRRLEGRGARMRRERGGVTTSGSVQLVQLRNRMCWLGNGASHTVIVLITFHVGRCKSSLDVVFLPCSLS
jgi:hypothetical protein